MTTLSYALCAGRHNIVVDGEDITEKSVYPVTVKSPLDFDRNIQTAMSFLHSLKETVELEECSIKDKPFTLQLVVTGLTPVLHAFIKAWNAVAPKFWGLTLGHYNRDESVYVWESLIEPFTWKQAREDLYLPSKTQEE